MYSKAYNVASGHKTETKPANTRVIPSTLNDKDNFLVLHTQPTFYLEIEVLKKSRLVLSMKIIENTKTIQETRKQQDNIKQFKKAFGLSPVQYRIQHKITVAKQLLAEGLPVGEIAASLGYPDIYSFTHQFTTVTGQSPSDFRSLIAQGKSR